jgi:chemotaxis protein CheX
MKTETVERIDAVIESATRALFASHGLTVGKASDGSSGTPDDHDVASSVGFTSTSLRGAVLLTARMDVVALAGPAELRHRTPAERDVLDWAGELVNQLLGRVKNALVPFGMALEQGTPTVVTGRHLHRAPASTNLARRFLFEAPGSPIAIYFDAAVSSELSLGSPRESLKPVEEGEVQLF